MNPVMLMAGAFYAGLWVMMILQLRVCRDRAEPMALLIVAIHGLAYFVALIFDYRDGNLGSPIFWNQWSSALRLHTVATVVIIETFRYLRLRGENRRGC